MKSTMVLGINRLAYIPTTVEQITYKLTERETKSIKFNNSCPQRLGLLGRFSCLGRGFCRLLPGLLRFLGQKYWIDVW